MGIAKSFPRDIVHGPTEFMGLGISNLYTDQGIAQLHCLIKFLVQPESITGQLLLALHEQMVVELGVNPPLFIMPFQI